MIGKKIGLVIGTNNYSDPKLSNLLFAVKDAKELRTVLLNPDIGGFDEIIPLVDETKHTVKKGIEKLLLKDATLDDLALIYFSGHGKLDSKFELNLLLMDTETDYLLSTALNYNFIADCIEQSKCKKVIVILDCCHSGAACAKGDIFNSLSETSGSGRFILSATLGSSLAREVETLENGVFTHFLLEGLRSGDADLGGDGFIDILELYEYASKRCNEKYSQVATIKSNFEERIVIGRNLLKIREKEYELKKSRLLEDFVSRLPPRVFDESMTILRNNYYAPSSLKQVDLTIYNLLESLLKDELSVNNYIEALQSFKGASINNKLLQNITLNSFSKAEVLNIENTTIPKNIKKHEIPKTFTSSSTGIKFILVPSGEFTMGSPSEKQDDRYDECPSHNVRIKNSFYMSTYPVTQKQWDKVMGNNSSNFKGKDRPVGSISWNDVQEFIKELNKKDRTDKYRLPSEAEWEYACRAGTQTKYFFGNDESKLGEYAWYDKNSDSEIHSIGKKKPNPWGLYDTNGNVWEWVQDRWHENYNGAPSDGSVWEDGVSPFRVRRGGCWNFDARRCRSASRSSYDPDDRSIYLGFRLLREL